MHADLDLTLRVYLLLLLLQESIMTCKCQAYKKAGVDAKVEVDTKSPEHALVKP